MTTQKLKLYLWLQRDGDPQIDGFFIKRSHVGTEQPWSGHTISDRDVFIEQDIEIELPEKVKEIVKL